MQRAESVMTILEWGGASSRATVQRQLRERSEQQVSARTRNGMLRAAEQGEPAPDMDVG